MGNGEICAVHSRLSPFAFFPRITIHGIPVILTTENKLTVQILEQCHLCVGIKRAMCA